MNTKNIVTAAEDNLNCVREIQDGKRFVIIILAIGSFLTALIIGFLIYCITNHVPLFVEKQDKYVYPTFDKEITLTEDHPYIYLKNENTKEDAYITYCFYDTDGNSIFNSNAIAPGYVYEWDAYETLNHGEIVRVQVGINETLKDLGEVLIFKY